MYTEALLFLTAAACILHWKWPGGAGRDSSMALAGGLCLCLIDRVCCSRLKDRDMLSRCTAGAGVITGVEFALGILLNRVLGLRIWDYSEVPLNLLGQVCLPYSLLWLGLSLPAIALCELLHGTETPELGDRILLEKNR